LQSREPKQKGKAERKVNALISPWHPARHSSLVVVVVVGFFVVAFVAGFSVSCIYYTLHWQLALGYPTCVPVCACARAIVLVANLRLL